MTSPRHDKAKASRTTQDSRRDAERNYEDILQNLQEGVFQTTPEGGFITANRALVEMLGFSSEQALIDSRKDIAGQHYVNPADRESFKRELRRFGKVTGFEFEAYRKDGTRIWLSENGRAVRDRDGSVLYYEGTAQDITQRKRAEETLVNLRRELELTMESMQEGIHRVDLNGNIAFENPAAARMLGWKVADLIGKPAHITMHHTSTEGLPYPIEDCPIYATLRDGIARDVTDEFFWRKDGTGFAVEYTTAPVRNNTNEIVAAVVTFRDITERKQAINDLRESEERYRELFENSRDAIYVHDMSGRYTSVNRAAEELSGFSRHEIIGKHYSNFIAPGYLREARESFCRKLDLPIETTYEAEVICKDGSRKAVEISSRMMSQNGEPIGVQGTVRDITERKRAQRAVQNYSQRLIQAQEAERESMARELHDEIGQALTAISMNLEWIRRSGAASPAVANRIQESIEVIDDTLRRVRELSLELRPSLLDDLGLAAALSWYAERFSTRTGIDTKVSGDLPHNGLQRAVQTALFRIAQEALTNTARHSRATSARVALAEVDRNLRLTISDNGVGFDAASLLNGSSGMALGLRGMQERARVINSHLQINATPGSGTQIVVEVPLTIAAKPQSLISTDVS